MGHTFDLNRLEFNILKCLYDSECTDQYHSMTITELLNKHTELGTRMTVYKKLTKLTKAKYVKKGILDNHADSFYLLEKALKILEEKESNSPIQQKKNKENISYDSNSVRDKLIETMDRGLMLKSIAVNAGISESELSRFKNGVDALKESDMKLLAEYLNAVVIPVWNVTKESEKQMTMRERILASTNRSIEKKKSTGDLLFM
ncbi:hypothetical protein GN277_12880 [Lachnospiraceae bacterium WCA-9-b2]|uniref:Uncharacterized protein n=1 Tax=Sporofaciens musculi TaxID=2681861 RepID=A0A7X3SJF0_9FIRM|nr:hypothetical protein [Sporofaciens musculi]MXP76256.1 hypothetical protein [Sporofaciens musculi]